MNKLPVLSAKDFYALLLRYGCVHIGTEGSHFKVENPKNGKCAPIPIHSGKNLPRGFMKKILVQLGIDMDDFIAYL
jgi:predicted RNA binding protein YcfA (HicA-like mRNA interferase family)